MCWGSDYTYLPVGIRLYQKRVWGLYHQWCLSVFVQSKLKSLKKKNALKLCLTIFVCVQHRRMRFNSCTMKTQQSRVITSWTNGFSLLHSHSSSSSKLRWMVRQPWSCIFFILYFIVEHVQDNLTQQKMHNLLTSQFLDSVGPPLSVWYTPMLSLRRLSPFFLLYLQLISCYLKLMPQLFYFV